MKKIYCKPESEIVNLELFGSVLEDQTVHNGSHTGKWEDAAEGKQQAFSDDLFDTTAQPGLDESPDESLWNQHFWDD